MAFRWRGRDEMLRAMTEARRRYLEAARRGVVEATAEIQGKAALQAPVREGVLRASASFFVDGEFQGDTGPSPKGKGPNRQTTRETAAKKGRIRGVIGFNTPYAAVQHEKKFRHPKGGTDKYLERAMKAIVPRIAGLIRKKMREAGF